MAEERIPTEDELREGGVEDGVVRDLEQARSNLQLAYADAIADSAQAPDSEEPAADGDAATPDE